MSVLKVDPRLPRAVDALTRLAPFGTATGIVLGSGLGNFCDALDNPRYVRFEDVPDMPAARVSGHSGTWCFGAFNGVPVLCQQGRVHLYEGHPIEDVVFGARLMAALGCKTVLLTNAAGGIADRLQPGDLMLITDHINLTARNPLVGHAGAFIDMTQTYDPSLANAARGAAQSAGVALKEGVYVGVLGPSYETPAEVRMLGRLGADAVGMSTVCEAIALRHAQVRVGAVSCITNAAATSDGPTLSHDDVKEQAARANSRFVSLLGRWIERIGGRT